MGGPSRPPSGHSAPWPRSGHGLCDHGRLGPWRLQACGNQRLANADSGVATGSDEEREGMSLAVGIPDLFTDCGGLHPGQAAVMNVENH
eukprot:4293237-Pyramimonas_sp.AAC.1